MKEKLESFRKRGKKIFDDALDKLEKEWTETFNREILPDAKEMLITYMRENGYVKCEISALNGESLVQFWEDADHYITFDAYEEFDYQGETKTPEGILALLNYLSDMQYFYSSNMAESDRGLMHNFETITITIEDVVFLLEKETGQPMAVFPNISADLSGNMQSYAHLGQHSACCLNYALEQPEATEEQYANLKAELESIGYVLRVRSKQDSFDFD